MGGPLGGNMLKPFFSYFGSKYRIAGKYPTPLCPEIIEPFAGSAGYSLRYPQYKISLYDKDPIIAGMWSFLIRATEKDIRSLPDTIETLDSLEFLDIPQEALHLIGFWLSKGSASPRKTPSAWNREWSAKGYKAFWGPHIKQRIASQLPVISHWQVFNKSFEDIDNRAACWYVDPPYQGKCGQSYRVKDIDYNVLSQWCRNRKGQVIVCENNEANWLPFSPLVSTPTTQGRGRTGVSHECIWYQEEDYLSSL